MPPEGTPPVLVVGVRVASIRESLEPSRALAPYAPPLSLAEVSPWFAAGLELIEIADSVSVDDIKAATGCEFKVATDLKSMES